MCDADTIHYDSEDSPFFCSNNEIDGNDHARENINHYTPEKLDANNKSDQENINGSCIISATFNFKSKFQCSIGLCICNILNYKFQITEIVDNEHFTAFESILLQLNPESCLISTPNDIISFKRLDKILSSCNVKKIYQDNFMGQWNVFEKSFSNLLASQGMLMSFYKEFDSDLIKMSVYKLVTHLNLTVSPFYNSKFKLSTYHPGDFMCLDKSSFFALNIFTKNGPSLYNLLNNCRTLIGSRRLHRWISQPLTSLDEISQRHDIVESFSNDPCCCRAIQAQFLRKVPDLDSIVAKMRLINSDEILIKKSSAQLLSFEDMYRLYECIESANEILISTFLDYIGDHKEVIERNFTKPLYEIVCKFKQYQLLVEQTVDFNQASTGNYVLNPMLHPDLQDIELKKKHVYDRVIDLKNEMIKELFPDQFKISFRRDKQLDDIIKLVDSNDYLHLFRVKKKDYSILESKMKKNSIEQVRLNKTEFLFTTESLRRLCKDISKLSNQYQILEKEVSMKALKIASSYWTVVEKLSDVVSKMDILLGFATLVITSTGRYVRPKMVSDGIIDLIQSRHPLVEINIDHKSFVPNNVKMVRDTSRVHIITGPNMGGKSTLIRQIALTCCMAQIGSFVPCTKATLSVFKKILCRVGAFDVQQRGLSTFMTEIVESSAILKAADRDSLVIIDELGRGTSTFEGFGIAWGILDYLINRESFVLCATHFHELSNIANERGCVINKTMGVANLSNNLTFTYSVCDGSSNLSYGINIAEMVKMPQEVIDNARIKLAMLEGSTNALDDCLKSTKFSNFCQRLSQISIL